jgi:hypothetical protein
MHSAEHRAIRELHATTRQLKNHWRRLAERLDEPFLAEGADTAGELLGELEHHNPKGRPAAQSVGTSLAGARAVSDVFLERNQAFRSALLDLNHVTTLVIYLEALGTIDGWSARLEALEIRGRARVREMAADPDAAIEPADGSPFGRAGAKFGEAVGTVGEAIDNSALSRLARRRTT